MATINVKGRMLEIKKKGNLQYVEKDGQIVPVHNNKMLVKDKTYYVLDDDKGYGVKEGSKFYHYTLSGDKKKGYSSIQELKDDVFKKKGKEKPTEEKPVEEKPEAKPEEKPAKEKPEAKPEEKPAKEKPEAKPEKEKPAKKSLKEKIGEIVDTVKSKATQLKQRVTSTNFEEQGYEFTSKEVMEYDPKTKTEHKVTYYGLSKGGKDVVPCVFPSKDLTTKYEMVDADGKIITASYAVKVGKDGKLSYKISYKTKGKLFADAKYEFTNDETEIAQGNGPFESVSSALSSVAGERAITNINSNNARKEAARIAADTTMSPEQKTAARKEISAGLKKERTRHDDRVIAINNNMLDECDHLMSVRKQRREETKKLLDAAEKRRQAEAAEKARQQKEKDDLDAEIDSSFIR